MSTDSVRCAYVRCRTDGLNVQAYIELNQRPNLQPMRQVRHEQTLWLRFARRDRSNWLVCLASQGVMEEAAAVTDVDPPAQTVSEQESSFND